jgi:hypothetical protein
MITQGYVGWKNASYSHIWYIKKELDIACNAETWILRW